ncbi:MAG TPA: TlpA disulfide reductase family protein [Gemmatimonadales bacterium]|nr:TlpA disulfide reductase family protein [Gemmatimonadales bacterium]
MGIALGATPPAVTIQDLDGRPANLGAMIGKKPLLIEFWATWCPLCAALMPQIDSAYARNRDKIAFVAVAVAVNESPASVKRHLAKEPHPWPFLWDANGDAVRAFQAPSTSYVVVLDAQGKVVYTGLGEDQDIEKALQRVVGDGRGR